MSFINDDWLGRLGWRDGMDIRGKGDGELVHRFQEKFKVVHNGRGQPRRVRVWASICGVRSHTEQFPPDFTDDPVTCMMCMSATE